MSWSELERLVEDAEADGAMRRALRHCRSRRELLLAAGRLGYAITSADLHQARMLERPCDPVGLRNTQPARDRSADAQADQGPHLATLQEAS